MRPVFDVTSDRRLYPTPNAGYTYHAETALFDRIRPGDLFFAFDHERGLFVWCRAVREAVSPERETGR